MKPRVAKLSFASILLSAPLLSALPLFAQTPVVPIEPEAAPPAVNSEAMPPVTPKAVAPAASPADNGTAYSNGYGEYYDGGWTSRRGLGLGLRNGKVLNGVWADVDSLIWWTKGRDLPPLVTTSPTGTPQNEAAIIGFPTTSVAFGNSQIPTDDPRFGGRVNLGAWHDAGQNVGLGTRFTAISGDHTNYDATSDGSTILGRPFYNVAADERDASLIAFPGEFAGDVHVRSARSFEMIDIYGRFRVSDDPVNRVDLLAGYEYVRIDDSLDITSTTNFINPLNPFFGAQFNINDHFRATSKYDLATLGLQGAVVSGRASFTWLGKVGYGNLQEVVKIDGASSVASGGSSIAIPGGLYAQTSNIGTFVDNRRVFVPEVNFNLNLQVTQRLTFTMGYTFLYFTNVAFAGDQIDRRVNLTQQSGTLVGLPLPAQQFNYTDFWLQGMNFGVKGSF